MGIEISLCMIVKNEEENLQSCLDSVKNIADEIIIVDTGSVDKTIEVAEKYTDKIYHFEWINDFSAARNFSFSKATKEYIMWLDADDTLTDENYKKLLSLKNTLDKNVDCIFMDYYVAFNENGAVTAKFARERIIKRSKNFKWINRVHETLVPEKKPIVELRTDIYVTHAQRKNSEDSLIRNLKILEDSINSGESGLYEMFYHGMTLYDLKRYNESYESFQKYFKMLENNPTGRRMMSAYLITYEVYLNRSEFENAYNILADNEAFFSDKSEFYTTLGDFARDILKDYESACYYYERALTCTGKEFDDTPSIVQNKDYYYYKPAYALGLCYNKLGNYDKSKRAFEIAAKYC